MNKLLIFSKHGFKAGLLYCILNALSVSIFVNTKQILVQEILRKLIPSCNIY